MSTVSIVAPEGVRLDVTLEKQIEQIEQRQKITRGKQTIQVPSATEGGEPQNIDLATAEVEIVNDTVLVWQPQTVTSFATDTRQFTIGPGERLVVTEGK